MRAEGGRSVSNEKLNITPQRRALASGWEAKGSVDQVTSPGVEVSIVQGAVS